MEAWFAIGGAADAALGSITIAQKIKWSTGTTSGHSLVPIGASFGLSPILSIMAFRTCKEDILCTPPPSENPS